MLFIQNRSSKINVLTEMLLTKKNRFSLLLAHVLSFSLALSYTHTHTQPDNLLFERARAQLKLLLLLLLLYGT